MLEIIGKEFFRDPKKVGIPMVTMHLNGGSVSFNLAAKERYELEKYNYLVFARCNESRDTFYVVPTNDQNNGWKITKYTNQVNTYLKICSQQLVELVSRACKVQGDKFQFYMHETDRTEKGFPIFSLTLKNH
jgi:hypothetical protein